jgi:hypothetical protein
MHKYSYIPYSVQHYSAWSLHTAINEFAYREYPTTISYPPAQLPYRMTRNNWTLNSYFVHRTQNIGIWSQCIPLFQISKPPTKQYTEKNYPKRCIKWLNSVQDDPKGIRNWRQKSQDRDQRKAIIEESKVCGHCSAGRRPCTWSSKVIKIKCYQVVPVLLFLFILTVKKIKHEFIPQRSGACMTIFWDIYRETITTTCNHQRFFDSHDTNMRNIRFRTAGCTV